ncbi:MAG: hypothetical protein GYA48_00315 [Chloroflexi bacterium]|nr:hypothetical protein [Chloroflexota bacterium]
MRKTYGLSIALCVFLLAGCNLPTRQAASDTGQVATSVALTLTAQPVELLIATPTIPPIQMATSQPVEPTATIAPQASATPTLTATPPAGDPRQDLGTPTWQRSMDDGKSFGLEEAYDDGNTRFEVSNGVMSISSNSSNGFRGWRLSNPKPQNMYLEGIFRANTCSGGDTYGLVFRAADYTSGYGYYAGFTCDGKYLLSRWTSSGTSTVISSTQSDLILSGSNQTNRLGILADGESISLYANGKLLETVTDTGISDGGHIGPFISAFSGGFSYALDEIAYWDLP